MAGMASLGMSIPRYGDKTKSTNSSTDLYSLFNSAPSLKPTSGGNIGTSISMPGLPQTGVQAGETAGSLQEYGLGLMDPNSQYFNQLMERIRTQMGKEAAAKKRSAALTGAEMGFGAGGQNVAQMQSAVDEAGLIGAGEAVGGAALAGPQLGAQIAGQGGQLGLGTAGLEQGGEQFGVSAGLQQQALAMQQQQQVQDQLMRMWGMALGSF